MHWDEKLFEMQWAQEIINFDEKMVVARKIASFVKDGDVIGVGSGSTSFLAIQEISRVVKEKNLKITAIPTSNELRMICNQLGLPTASIFELKPDWCFDGADEVDSNSWLIKGRGGAMFNEKLIMVNSPKRYIIVDNSKFVSFLGEKFPVPVECVPSALTFVKEQLYRLKANKLKLRLAGKAKDGPIITENGNYIVDAYFNNITSDLEAQIKAIVGVIESGLFISYNPTIIKA